MSSLLPLDKMTTDEKLRAMEQLWDDLCRTPEAVPSPSWHEDVLASREKRVRGNRAIFFGLKEAKDRVRKATR